MKKHQKKSFLEYCAFHQIQPTYVSLAQVAGARLVHTRADCPLQLDTVRSVISPSPAPALWWSSSEEQELELGPGTAVPWQFLSCLPHTERLANTQLMQRCQRYFEVDIYRVDQKKVGSQKQWP